MNGRDPAALLQRAVSRLRWTTYRLGVRARRAALDVRWGPARQATASALEGRLSGGTAVHRVEPPAAIEPSSGYAVHGRLGVIEQSLPYSYMARNRDELHYFSGVPRVHALLRRTTPVTVPGTAISLAHPFANNYFHAVTEIFGSLAAVRELGLLDGNTVLVPADFAASAVWREFIAATDVPIEHRVLGDRWITGETGVAYVVPKRTRADFDRTLELLAGVLPPRTTDPDSDVRLFIGRPPNVGRSLRNQALLQAALEARSFRAVEPGDLSWTDQVELFRRARVVVAVHGAAVTNIIYRSPQPLTLIELRSPVMDADMYEQMAGELDFEYVPVVGHDPGGGGNMASFEVDVDRVLAAVDDVP